MVSVAGYLNGQVLVVQCASIDGFCCRVFKWPSVGGAVCQLDGFCCRVFIWPSVGGAVCQYRWFLLQGI